MLLPFGKKLGSCILNGSTVLSTNLQSENFKCLKSSFKIEVKVKYSFTNLFPHCT